MEIDERKAAVVFSFVAVTGIAFLFLLSETAKESSVAEALVAAPNSLLKISGRAENVTSEKFMLCDTMCISVRTGESPSAALLYNGRAATAIGRLKDYRGSVYIEAEVITSE